MEGGGCYSEMRPEERVRERQKGCEDEILMKS